MKYNKIFAVKLDRNIHLHNSSSANLVYLFQTSHTVQDVCTIIQPSMWARCVNPPTSIIINSQTNLGLRTILQAFLGGRQEPQRPPPIETKFYSEAWFNYDLLKDYNSPSTRLLDDHLQISYGHESQKPITPQHIPICTTCTYMHPAPQQHTPVSTLFIPITTLLKL